MAEAVKRISTALQSEPQSQFLSPDVYSMSIRKSFVMSVDQAHAVHPNYAAKHEKLHAPKMNSGVVIKTNQNQRYATEFHYWFHYTRIDPQSWHFTRTRICRPK